MSNCVTFWSCFDYVFPNDLLNLLSFTFSGNYVELCYVIVLGFNGLCFDLLKPSCGSTYYFNDMFCMGMSCVLMFQHIILVGFKP
jgi:hypothetical protein